MMHLWIDGVDVEVPAGATVLEAARKAGAEIPTLCHMERFPPYTSCMLCVVRDEKTDALIPSCSARAVDGMSIKTTGEEIEAARRSVLELLLSEHVGDCEAPCRLACPAYMDIPAMIRHIRAGDSQRAMEVVKEHIPLPGILGRICPAPCEKACRRSTVDEPVAICLLKRFIADTDLQASAPWFPPCAPDTGRCVAVVGAGPAGLSAAYFLRRSGLRCEVFEKEARAGGALRTAILEAVLPASVVDAEIEQIGRMGMAWHTGVALGIGTTLATLRTEFDAVILAVGNCTVDQLRSMGLPVHEKGLEVSRPTMAVAGMDGVFAAGACVHTSRMAVRAVADGNMAAASVCRWLGITPAASIHRRFNSRIATLSAADREVCMQEAEPILRQAVPAHAGLTGPLAMREASRCMRCDCRDKADCSLRSLSERYDARSRTYLVDARAPVSKVVFRDGTLLEEGKCIRCGRCVRICEAAGVPAGLAFTGRGADVRVGVPFGGDLADVPANIVQSCIEACPTGALATFAENHPR